MRSSASTRNRSSDETLRLHLWVVGDDHPRACTGRRLVRAGLVQAVGRPAPPFRGVLLDPHAATPLSPADRTAARAGLAAVDCSWNRLARRGGYPTGPFDRVPPSRRRRLPWLLAANPHHFGRVGELNTVEALAAALVVLGESDHARRLLDAVGANDALLRLNSLALAAYGTAADASAVQRAETDLFGG